MASNHELQARYATLVDKKLRASLVKKPGIFWNTRYEGNPKAGMVKIPVRDAEVAIKTYDRNNGADMTFGATSYLDMPINKEYAVNELIDGYEAAAVPDNLVADRLDSAGYSMSFQVEKDGTACLESAATALGDTTAIAPETIYGLIVDARTAMGNAYAPNDGRRWLAATPTTLGIILKSPEFISASSLGDEVKQTGALGRIAGFNVYEDPTLSATTDFIVGHPDWCHFVEEWKVPIAINNLADGKHIGASAVQGRSVYGFLVSKAKTLYIKKNAGAGGGG